MQNGSHWVKTQVRAGLVPLQAPGENRFWPFPVSRGAMSLQQRGNMSAGPGTRTGTSLGVVIPNNSNNS